MAEYHVGCGITEIFAGTLRKRGDRWLNKSIVTDEACSAVAQFLMDRDESFVFKRDGKQYRLFVQEMEGAIRNETDN